MQTAQAAVGAISAALQEKIKARTAKVGILGLGYVGLPLASEFAKAGFTVTGIDVQASKVDQLNAGQSYVQDVPTESFRKHVDAGKFRATTDFSVISELDTINIAVPTPLRKTKDPDMSYVVAAAEEVAKYAHPGLLVILESTTYPGTTEELLLPMLEKSGLKVGVDFFLCFSPERVDPGNPKYQTRNIPKVVGGITPACTEVGALLYSQALDTVVPVSSTSVAEMVKLLENTFRMINIGLVNELAMMCDRMGINVWEVIDAAGTKPFGFMPFYPGPRLGRPLHSHRSFLPLLEDEAGRHRGPFHRTGRLYQRPNASFRRGQDPECAERSRQACEGLSRARCGRRLQARHRRCAGIARAGHHPPAEKTWRSRNLQRSICS